MNVRTRINFLLCTVSLAAAPALAWQVPKPQPFSADYTAQTTAAGGRSVTGKIYVSSPKIRIEANTGGRAATVISDQVTQISEILMPQQNMYMEIHVNQDNPMLRGVTLPPNVDPNHPCSANATCENVGTETVNGRTCDKWVTTDTKGTSTAWIDQKLHFPIKAQNANGAVWQVTNIKEGPPDPSLFEVPPGYRKFDMPAAMGGAHPPQ
jgi:hypothetical protein